MLFLEVGITTALVEHIKLMACLIFDIKISLKFIELYTCIVFRN